MAEMKKLKRTALVMFGIVSVLLLGNLAYIDYLIWIRLPAAALGIQPLLALSNIITLISFAAIIVFFVISLTLLYAIRKEETPFTLGNVKRLKAIAGMLVLLELCQYLVGLIDLHYHPHMNGYGETATIVLLPGVTMLVAGLLIYCVALAFQAQVALGMMSEEGQ